MSAFLLSSTLCWLTSPLRPIPFHPTLLALTPKTSSSSRASRVRCLLPPLPHGGSSVEEAAAVPVDIVVTGINSRCISASCVIAASPDQVWKILTDYDNLSTHVPNLVKSERRPHPTGGIRLFQEGAQKIVGFDFRASLTMDMTEVTEEGRTQPSRIKFTLVESLMFAAFEGEWRLQPYSRVRSRTKPGTYHYTTKLSYRVNITPKGLVPVPALEWRIREDVPVNLLAVRDAALKLRKIESDRE
mmetsp:Transcript_38394/g.95509  ORF Transcript_38394/g.95509 Transcript_38394/m.95509 type:complete len:244 (+) Transcript_38394:214-945(+)